MSFNSNIETNNIKSINPSLANKVIDIMANNRDFGSIIASSIGTSIIIYVIAKCLIEVIKAFRNSGD